QALELRKLTSVVVAADIVQEMATLNTILQDARGLLQDLATLQRLFDPTNIPHTLPAMRQRVSDMDKAMLDARNYGLRVHMLVSTILSTVRHLTSLVNGINAFVGNMQSNQSLAQYQASIEKTLTITQVQAASQQRIDTLERMRHEVIVAMHKDLTRQYW